MASQVARVSPLAPIGVLIALLAVALHLMHGTVMLGNGTVQQLRNTCLMPTYQGRYVTFIPKQYRGEWTNHANDLFCFFARFFQASLENPAQVPIIAEFVPLLGLTVAVFYIAANRSSAGLVVRWGPFFFLVVTQLLGAAIATPAMLTWVVYYGSRSARASFIPSGVARALMPAIEVGYFLPIYFLQLKGIISDSAIDWAITIWNPFPVYVAILLLVLGASFHSPQRNTSDAMVSTTFIVAFMDFIVLTSFLFHLRAVYACLTNGLSLSDYLLDFSTTNLTTNVHAFLTVDFLVTTGSLWTLIVYDSSRFANLGTTGVRKSLLVLAVGTVLVGPGGAAAWAWSQVERARLQALVADRIKADGAGGSKPASPLAIRQSP